ncbi:MAG: class I SAM-dependent methyltransferase [Planctomycetota bacterium]
MSSMEAAYSPQTGITGQSTHEPSEALPAGLADTIAAEVREQPASRSAGWLIRVCRSGLLKRLDQLNAGQLTLIDGDEEFRFGSPVADQPPAVLHVHSAEFFRRVALGGSLGFAEAFILGEWTSQSPRDVVRIFCRNMAITEQADRGPVRVFQSIARRWHERHENSKRGSRQNIHAHYDLGNDFYSLFLDETMTYSCGVFESPASTLYDAQVAKIDRICRKLDLQPTDHLIEIGTGWGALAIHAAQQYGCRVTTTTISREQYDFARRRVAEAGLEHRITLLLDDYRDLTGQYDKLASVEMIEAVGFKYFDSFFRKCGELLKPDGQMMIQGITLAEQRYPRYLRSVDFIQRYIFPGGCLITPATVLQSVARTSDLRLLHIEDLAPHYARTLNEWRQRFFARLPEIRQQGFPATFIRLWDFYLSYCEAAFEERHVGTVQMQFAKPLCRTDPITSIDIC